VVKRGDVIKVSSTVEGALRNIIRAWEALPGGQSYTDIAVERWLRRDMKPAIDRARRLLGMPTEKPSTAETGADFAGVNDKQLFRAMRHARGEELEALRREASRRGLQEEVRGE
jgi:DICT domain-containing protein